MTYNKFFDLMQIKQSKVTPMHFHWSPHSTYNLPSVVFNPIPLYFCKSTSDSPYSPVTIKRVRAYHAKLLKKSVGLRSTSMLFSYYQAYILSIQARWNVRRLWKHILISMTNFLKFHFSANLQWFPLNTLSFQVKHLPQMKFKENNTCNLEDSKSIHRAVSNGAAP